MPDRSASAANRAASQRAIEIAARAYAERNPCSPRTDRLEGELRRVAALSRGRQHHLRQELLALLLGAIACHRRGEALQNTILKRRDDGVVDVALAADRRRIGELVGSRTHGLQHLLLAAAGARRRRKPRHRFPAP